MDRFSEIYKEITSELNTCNHKWLELRDLLNKTDTEDKAFYSLDEAKEYAISLGINKDWKERVYQYLRIRLEV